MTQENNNDSENISNYKRELLDQTFRDSVSTISKEGNRNYINPQKPVGRLYNLRSYFSYFYLVLFFTLPFIKVEGEPVFLFNVLERKFIFFSKICYIIYTTIYYIRYYLIFIFGNKFIIFKY